METMKKRLSQCFCTCGLLLYIAPVAATDMTVFGLTLGKELTISDCEVENSDPCFSTIDTLSLEDMGIREVAIYFPTNKPLILKGHIIGTVVDGKLERVDFSTHGMSDFEIVIAELKRKYGKPSSVDPLKFTNALGAHIDAVSMFWRLPNLSVTYDSVHNRIDEGEIWIGTDKGYEALDLKNREFLRNRPHL